jgi:hypothetical protein
MVTHLLAAVMATGLAVGAESASAGRSLLEDAARDYRIQVYETFRLDRPEFDRRRAEWRQLEQSWEAAGRLDREMPALLDWLAEATAQSQSDSIGELPEAPKIVAEVKKLPAVGQVAKPVTAEKPNSSNSAEAKPSPDAAANEPSKTTPSATPVSSRNTPDAPALEEKKPDETAPVSAPIVPDPEAKDDAAKRPTAPAGAATWLHNLGHELGEDLNSFGLTLAWKREPKP